MLGLLDERVCKLGTEVVGLLLGILIWEGRSGAYFRNQKYNRKTSL